MKQLCEQQREYLTPAPETDPGDYCLNGDGTPLPWNTAGNRIDCPIFRGAVLKLLKLTALTHCPHVP